MARRMFRRDGKIGIMTGGGREDVAWVQTSGRLALAMRSHSARAAAGRTPCLASRIAPASAVLIRGLAANLAGKPARHVGQLLLPFATHREKHDRQKLCWHGACGRLHRQPSKCNVGGRGDREADAV